ncbi:MAG: hypothetical protein ACK41O_04195 [Runella zeae]
MIRLSVITQSQFTTLGANGLVSFIETGCTDKINTIQHIDDDFLQLAEAMKTYPYGFTVEMKAEFLALLQAHKGQKCLITTNWIYKRSSPKSDYLMRIVEKINKGEPLSEAEAEKLGKEVKYE